MSTQQQMLFVVPPAAHARHSDPPTSHMAAAAVNVGLSQMIVLAIFKKIGEATDGQLWEAIELLYPATDRRPISESGSRTRRKELVTAGYIKFSGRYGVTAAGNKSKIWELVK